MSNSDKNDSGEQPEHKRRASDRGASNGGIETGGRRQSDTPHAMPRSNAGKIAIACSFFFSAGLIAWAFTLPFRSSGDAEIGLQGNLPQAELANLEYEARLSPQAYVDYTRQIDRRLLDQVQDKRRKDWDVPTAQQTREKWGKSIENRKEQLIKIRKGAGENGYHKDSIEAQYEREAQQVMQDAPPEA